jgi:parvulin-like peptidyl-prolyl isomerase
MILALDTTKWVLAFGENDTIHLGTYLNMLPGYTYDIGRDSLSEDDKKNLLVNSIAMPIILEEEARKKGYADLVEYSAEKRIFTLQDAERRVIAQRVNENFPSPAPEEIKAYYQAHRIDFPPVGVPIHVYHIVFDDSLKAVEVLKQLKNGGDFVELAKKYFPGESEIKDVAYDLGFITQGEMPEEFYLAASNLKVGEVSPPVRTKWGFHLIKLVEKKENETTLNDLTPQITRVINLEKARKHLADWERNLFTQSDVWINQKLLSRLVLPKPEG